MVLRAHCQVVESPYSLHQDGFLKITTSTYQDSINSKTPELNPVFFQDYVPK